MDDPRAILRQLPKIDELLKHEAVCNLEPRWAVVEALRREVDSLRQAILGGVSDSVDVDLEAVAKLSASLARPSIRPVVNATGVVLHTNLGRAPLPAAAISRIAELAAGYCNLEYDIDAGKRGSRHGHLAGLVTQLCGAEDAVVVNNNASAVMLGLAALSTGRECIVSRGELVEIGGAFRIPDVMELSGAHLVEVGTTNKTRASDYERAVTEQTGLLLKVHQSNFQIVGFTEEASLEELVDIGHRLDLPVMMDLGSGALMEAAEMAAIGLPAEPSARATCATGADLVTFSGDKLLGGPQAGIIAGSREAVAKCRRHPLMRAFRPDKMTMAALEVTFSLYRDNRAQRDVPAVAMLTAPLDLLRERAVALAQNLTPPAGITANLVACESTVGGGALPTSTLPSWGIALAGRSAEAFDRGLRAAPVPVVGRVIDDQLVLDVRTLARDEDLEHAQAAISAL